MEKVSYQCFFSHYHEVIENGNVLPFLRLAEFLRDEVNGFFFFIVKYF